MKQMPDRTKGEGLVFYVRIHLCARHEVSLKAHTSCASDSRALMTHIASPP